MQNAGTARPRPPAARKQRHVVQDLMDATEHAPATKTAKEITVREISMAAGTNEAMIHYYFGSKEGLIVAMFQDTMRLPPHNCDDGILDPVFLRDRYDRL